MKKYRVETVSLFRHRYVVEAQEAEHAKDEVVMNLSNDEFKEFSQMHIDEVISTCREISDEEYLRSFDEDNEYLKEWSQEQKLAFVNKIVYNDNSLNEG